MRRTKLGTILHSRLTFHLNKRRKMTQSTSSGEYRLEDLTSSRRNRGRQPVAVNTSNSSPFPVQLAPLRCCPDPSSEQTVDPTAVKFWPWKKNLIG